MYRHSVERKFAHDAGLGWATTRLYVHLEPARTFIQRYYWSGKQATINIKEAAGLITGKKC